MVSGKRPPARPKACAPNSARGSVTRAMGRELRLASPVKVAVIGVVAMAPMISRTPVPELPQSMTWSGSANPPTPTPCTDHSPGPCCVTSAPKAFIALAVSSTSCPSRRPDIRVSPTAMAPRIRLRWLTDLSPGISAVPLSGPERTDCSGLGAPWADIRGLQKLRATDSKQAKKEPAPNAARQALGRSLQSACYS